MARGRRVQAQAVTSRSHPTKPGFIVFDQQVVITIDKLVIHCDYAEQNRQTSEVFARGNLRIRLEDKSTVSGKELYNDPNQDFIIVNEDVIYTSKDKKTQLFTDKLFYDDANEIASYYTGGEVRTDSTVLVSKIGHSHTKTGAFYCKTDVVITHPRYTIYTDTLKMLDDTVHFFSPTKVYADENYMYCEQGWYHAPTEVAWLYQNAFVQTSDQKLYGDTIYYRMKDEYGEAMSHVVMIDSVRDMTVYCDYALNQRKLGNALFTKNVLGMMMSDADTLFFNSDTLYLTYDSTETMQVIQAYHGVRFFRQDMQGCCDSLCYVAGDSTMRMYQNPILWSNSDQITGDSIILFLSNKKPQTMNLSNHAFVISQGFDTTQFNQLKGQTLKGFFNDSSQLERVDIMHDVETLYYVIDEKDSTLIGILKVNAKEMTMHLSEQRIESIRYLKPDDGSMFPESELPVEDRILTGFTWQDALRPKTKTDVFPKSMLSFEVEN
ncbi:hypothetical protein FACS1894201_07980 [Bacteroidia bacterium]|nr:hypothetical protein FACS1894201_07980 [Bacteroidia bacterium]